jgi:hypothetical protein
MALLKGIFSSSRRHKDAGRDPLCDDSNLPHGPETMPVMMNLEERMAFRRELLFESIRVSMNQRSIAPNAYRAKVMRVDKRGHSFIVMFDMSPTFMLSPAGQRTELVATAALLTQNAKKNTAWWWAACTGALTKRWTQKSPTGPGHRHPRRWSSRAAPPKNAAWPTSKNTSRSATKKWPSLRPPGKSKSP